VDGRISFALSPDGSLIASLGTSIQVWDVAGGNLIASRESLISYFNATKPTEGVGILNEVISLQSRYRSISFISDGNMIVVGSTSATVIFDLRLQVCSECSVPSDVCFSVICVPWRLANLFDLRTRTLCHPPSYPCHPPMHHGSYIIPTSINGTL
jgi:WD40 repeat protein